MDWITVSMFFSSCMSVDQTPRTLALSCSLLRWGKWCSWSIFRDRCSCVLGLCYCRSSQLCSATMFGRFTHCRTATLRMTRNIVPLTCCECACSATRLLGRHPSRCSPPFFHNHVRVNSVLAARTACLASRVACVRAWSWLSHSRPPDRSQHGCTVGVDRDPPVWCSTRAGWWNIRAPARAVLVGVLWCVVHGLWNMLPLRFVLCSLTYRNKHFRERMSTKHQLNESKTTTFKLVEQILRSSWMEQTPSVPRHLTAQDWCTNSCRSQRRTSGWNGEKFLGFH